MRGGGRGDFKQQRDYLRKFSEQSEIGLYSTEISFQGTVYSHEKLDAPVSLVIYFSVYRNGEEKVYAIQRTRKNRLKSK